MRGLAVGALITVWSTQTEPNDEHILATYRPTVMPCGLLRRYYLTKQARVCLITVQRRRVAQYSPQLLANNRASSVSSWARVLPLLGTLDPCRTYLTADETPTAVCRTNK